MVLVEEPDAIKIGDYPPATLNDGERELFAATHASACSPNRPALHAMLVLTGGSAWEAGASTILGAPFQSFLFDLIDGPDNWHLVRAVPADRGVVCGALRPESPADQSPELVWAANYAASSMGRGLERVGLSNGSSFASLGDGRDRRGRRPASRVPSASPSSRSRTRSPRALTPARSVSPSTVPAAAAAGPGNRRLPVARPRTELDRGVRVVAVGRSSAPGRRAQEPVVAS